MSRYRVSRHGVFKDNVQIDPLRVAQYAVLAWMVLGSLLGLGYVLYVTSE